MRYKRIIPCLDVRDGRVVKGVNFEGIRDAGDPAIMAKAFCESGADEIIFLDITASQQRRGIMKEVVAQTLRQISIPLTVGGGMRTIEDFGDMFSIGVNKVSINTAALLNPKLISNAADEFGSGRIVCAIDAKRKTGGFEVYINGGKQPAGKDAIEWAREVERKGAGEILVTSMDADGTKNGYDIPLTKAIAEAVDIPVIASGGAGKLEHLKDAILLAGADAVLVASIFHFGECTVQDAKQYLKNHGISVRLQGEIV